MEIKSLESILGGYYIKYESLFRMCNEAFKDVNINNNNQHDSIDIYIDIFDMIKPIYTTEYSMTKKYGFVSAIINLAAHFRTYFWSRHRLYPKIYMIYGDYTNTNIYCPEMNNRSITNTVNYLQNKNLVDMELELVKILCAYINNIYFIKRSSNCGMFILDNINKNNNHYAIIISKDKLLYQIPALLNNAIIFRPKKNKGEDLSYYINKNNVLRLFFTKASPGTITNLSAINPELLSVLIALNGFPQYNIKSIVNINTAISLLNDAINNNRLLNKRITDIRYLYKQLYGIENYTDETLFINRFNAIDILFNYAIYNSSIESKDISWNLNLSDAKTIKDINNKFFANNPLDLNAF